MLFPDTDWIFFDCFNTLIDDFDEAGDESGLGTMPQRAAALGFYPSASEFAATYHKVRRETAKVGREVPLPERLRLVLDAGRKDVAFDQRESAVNHLVEAWEHEYRGLLRPTPGVLEMLKYWSTRRPLGVVSNFFLPGYPKKFLAEAGLLGYFRFVLDSAGFGFKKPNPLLLMEAMSLAGLGMGDASRVLMIGDRPDLDIAPAQELGMHVLHFNRHRTRPGVGPAPAGVPMIDDWNDFR
jgi:FMN phosphatase YigB (HAD superfamily)